MDYYANITYSYTYFDEWGYDEYWYAEGDCCVNWSDGTSECSFYKTRDIPADYDIYSEFLHECIPYNCMF